MGDGRALFHGEFGGKRELAVESADDQEAHRFKSFFVFSCRGERMANSE
jgi:hypothetical protein